MLRGNQLASLILTIMIAAAGPALANWATEDSFDSSLDMKSDDETLTGSGGSTTFTTSWGGSSYTEQKDPLKRFSKFTLSDPDGDGLVQLSSLAPPPLSMPVKEGLAYTDAEIETFASAFGLTRLEIAEDIEKLFQGNSQEQERAERAMAHILGGRYNEAMLTLDASDAELTIWCGNAEHDWYIAIPVALGCNSPGDLGRMLAAIHVASVPVYDVGVDYTGQLVFQMREVGLSVEALGTDPNDVKPDLFGLGYKNWHLGARTLLQKYWTVDAHLMNLDPGNKDTRAGTVRFTTEGNTTLVKPFSQGDVFIVTDGNTIDDDHTINTTISTTTSYFGTSFGVLDFGQHEWKLRSHYHRSDVVEETNAFFRFAQQHALRLRITNDAPGLEFGYQLVDGGTVGTQRILSIDNPAALPYIAFEARATYFVDQKPYVDFQFVGLPEAAEPEPAALSTNRILMDMGEDGDRTASIGVSKESIGTIGHYRSLVVTSRIPDLSFDATIGGMNRTHISVGAMDPIATGKPHVLLGANFVMKEATSKIGAFEGKPLWYHATFSPDRDLPDPTGHNWTYSADNTCDRQALPCEGKLADGAVFHGDGDLVHMRFWAIDEMNHLTTGSCPEELMVEGACY